MIHYSVPTKTAGLVTRSSAGHKLAAPGYRFVTVHLWDDGSVYGATWHSTRELARKASTGHQRTRPVEVVEIQPEHMREPKPRIAKP